MNKICPKCGAKIERALEVCPNCQPTVEAANAVCEEHKRPLSRQPIPQAYSQVELSSNKSAGAYVKRIALIFLLMGALTVSYWQFWVKPIAYPALTRQAQKLSIPKRVALYKDQAQVVSFFGYPNDFQVTFDQNTGDRTEIWLYFEGNLAYVFKNGRFITDDQLLPEVRASAHVTHLRPEEINGLLTRKELAELLGKPTYQIKDKLNAVDNLEVIGFEDAVVMFRNDKLVFFQSRPGLPPLEEQI